MSTDLPGREFRWRFYDAVIGDQWSEWHTTTGPCPGCCCGGPNDGEHREGAGWYDKDGMIDFGGHARLDPTDIDDHDTVEWRP